MPDANKRVYAYLLDTLFMHAVSTAAAVLPVPLAVVTAVDLVLMLFRDAATPTGSFGKKLAGLQLEGLGTTWAARFSASFRRNLPLQIFFFGDLIPLPPSHPVRLISSVLAILVTIVEYIRVRRGDGRRYGDLLAHTTVRDAHPESAGAKYLLLSLLVVALNALLTYAQIAILRALGQAG